MRLDEAIKTGRPFRRSTWDESMWLHVTFSDSHGVDVVEFITPITGDKVDFLPLVDDLSADDYVVKPDDMCEFERQFRMTLSLATPCLMALDNAGYWGFDKLDELLIQTRDRCASPF